MAKNNSLAFLPFLKRQPPLTIKDGQGHLAAELELQAIDAHGAQHPLASYTLKLQGPGDILGFSRNMIARLEPPADSHDFEPNYFPFVEFVDPDFCWRYSLDNVTKASRRVHPWLSLIVLSATEIEEMTRAGIEVITLLENRRQFLSVYGRYLPKLKEAWGTAHVHLSNLKKPVLEFIANNPASHCCRLFCFRKLQAETRYTAFIVPNYEIAVQAAFGSGQDKKSNKKAWVNPADDDILKLPIYFSWTFSTSESGDFESLARKLKPTSVDESKVGTRAVEANWMGSPAPPRLDRFFLREGALAPPGFSDIRNSYDAQNKSLPSLTPMLNSLNESLQPEPDPLLEDIDDDVDPLITRPVYGRYFQKTTEIKPPQFNQWAEPSPWIHELNLDLRYRVAAALGTRAVQKNQEEYMKECWSQVGEIRKANEKLRQVQVGYILSKAIEQKHLNPLSDERFALISTPFHAHFAANEKGTLVSIKRELADSGISPGVYSSTFKRVSNRQIGINQVKPSSAIAKAKHPACSTSTSFSAMIATPEPTRAVLREVFGMEPTIKKPKTEMIPVKDIKFDSDFRKKFNIKNVLKNKLHATLVFTGPPYIPEDFNPIMAHPVIDIPMYRPLRKLSKDYIIPGIENLANNGVTLLEENRRFIEAYMVGINHEMGRELVWRNYPTDQRGTIFSYFWDQVVANDPAPDIKKIHKWTQNLGDNKANGNATKNLVLVIKGDLIRRYPKTIVYVIEIKGKENYWSELDEYKNSNPVLDGSNKIDPIIRAQVGADILCVGFPFSKKEILGNKRKGEYYFVLQEHHDLPRFGLDVASKRIKPSPGCDTQDIDINQLSWGDIKLDKAGYITKFDKELSANNNPDSVTSATIAMKTYQLPIRIAIHASELLANED